MRGVTASSCGKSCRTGNGHTGKCLIRMWVLCQRVLCYIHGTMLFLHWFKALEQICSLFCSHRTWAHCRLVGELTTNSRLNQMLVHLQLKSGGILIRQQDNNQKHNQGFGTLTRILVLELCLILFIPNIIYTVPKMFSHIKASQWMSRNKCLHGSTVCCSILDVGIFWFIWEFVQQTCGLWRLLLFKAT